MSSGCSRQGAAMAPSSASSRTWRAILQDEVCPCPCNDCNGHTSPHHRGSGTSANQVRSQPHGKRLCFGCFAFISMLLHAVPFGLQAIGDILLPCRQNRPFYQELSPLHGKSRCTANYPHPASLSSAASMSNRGNCTQNSASTGSSLQLLR